MPSRSLTTWRASATRALEQLEIAHAAVGRLGPGRRYAEQQVTQAYVVALSSQFQRFCRDLHSEAADHITATIPSLQIRDILRTQLTGNRRLDHGNPNPGNIGSDFARFDMEFWRLVSALDRRNEARRRHLEALNLWRNAIAHQDFDPAALGGRTELRVSEVRAWRAACEALATDFDRAI